MKKRMLIASFGFLLILAGCSASGEEEKKTNMADLSEKDWNELENQSIGSELNIFMWGGDEGINTYIDDFVTPHLNQAYDIKLNRIPMDTEDIIQKLLTEKRAGQYNGTMDIIWINGDNFRNAKANDLLAGSFITMLPNFSNYIGNDKLHVQYDQGTEIEGLEAPWGSAQYVFFYNEAYMDPPGSFSELKKWVKENPGKFTYPNPKDFTGNGFLTHLLYEAIDEPGDLFEREIDENFADTFGDEIWNYLNDIKPYLWRNGETYPESLEQLDQLYSQGEVWMTMGYNEARAESLIRNGVFPETTNSFILDTGSVGGVHYLSIPFNTTEPEGALVAINYMLSPEAQLKKMDPAMWGEGLVLEPELLSEDDIDTLESIDRGSSVLPANILRDAFLPEVDTAYKDWLRENWTIEVVQE